MLHIFRLHDTLLTSMFFISRHSATLLEDQMVMFGGWDYPTVFNDLHILDLSKYSV